MTLENKQYNSYQELKKDYIKSAEELQNIIHELDAVIDEIHNNDTIALEDSIEMLNDQSVKLSTAYLTYSALANQSIDKINQEIKKLEYIYLNDCYDDLITWNEENDQVFKELDYLGESFDDANETIKKKKEELENKLEDELGNE